MSQFTRRIATVVLLAPALLIGGCEFLGGLLGPTTTTVLLVNSNDPTNANESFPFEVRLFYGDDQLVLEAILVETGQEREFTIPAGQSRSFSVDCDELQAIIIDAADLSILGSIGPGTSSRVYRDGDDFNCGDTLVFTFSGTAIPPHAEVAFEATSGAAGLP